MDEKTSPSEVFTTIRTREDEYAYLEKDDEQAQKGEVFLDGSWQLLQDARPLQHEKHDGECPPSPPQHQDY